MNDQDHPNLVTSGKSQRVVVDGYAFLINIHRLETDDTWTLEVSYAGFWVIRPDQAARFSATLVATPSVNVTPSMSKGNWFAPFR
uniref:hypothetical protein n=1 Tax=Pelagibacterium sediminicola TaxID=2248761 RepID=UPI0013008DD6